MKIRYKAATPYQTKGTKKFSRVVKLNLPSLMCHKTKLKKENK